MVSKRQKLMLDKQARNTRAKEKESPMPDHKEPGTHPDPQKDQCAVQLHGYIECCCKDPEPMCSVFKHLPCSVEGEQIIQHLTQLLTQNPGYHVQQVLDHGHDGWTIILTGPCCK